jgi:hypothetical protein
MRLGPRWTVLRVAYVVTTFSTGIRAQNILETIGFTSCQNGSATIQVEKVNIQYNAGDKFVSYDLAGSSSRSQNVTGELVVTAFGNEVFSQKFNPCDPGTFVQQLCPGMDSKATLAPSVSARSTLETEGAGAVNPQ